MWLWDWSNDAENSVLITEINYILKCIPIENSDLKFNDISQFLLYFLSNKFSLSEQESRNKKYLKNKKTFGSYWPKLLNVSSIYLNVFINV